MKRSDVEWCNTLFDSMADGGMWGVPRSGLIFSKDGDSLVLTNRMPYNPSMLCSARDIGNYQEEDYLLIKEYFEAAGIKVRNGLK